MPSTTSKTSPIQAPRPGSRLARGWHFEHLRYVWRLLMGLVLLTSLLVLPAHAQTADPDDGRSALSSEIQLWLARHQGVHPQQVEITPLDSRLQVPTCPGGWSMSLPFNNTQSVRARCDSLEPARQYIVRTNIQAPQQEVVTAQSLPTGHILQSQDLMLRPSPPGQRAWFSDPQSLLGRVLVHDMPKGFSVHPDDLDSQVTIYRLARSTFAGDRLTPQDLLPSRIAFEQAPPAYWSGNWPAAPTVASALPAGHILRAEDWAVMVPAVVANTDIPRGTQLTPNMLMVKSLPKPHNGIAYVPDVDQLAYSETTRLIRRGSPISKFDVRAAVLVKRGNTVTISVGKGRGFEISTQVEALEDGRLGEQIRLINRQSGRIISGVVTASNQVEAL